MTSRWNLTSKSCCARRNHAVTERIEHGTEPRAWREPDVETVLKQILLAIDRVEESVGRRRVTSRCAASAGSSSRWASEVVIAIEIPMGAAVAGPFAIEPQRLDEMIRRVIAAAAAPGPTDPLTVRTSGDYRIAARIRTPSSEFHRVHADFAGAGIAIATSPYPIAVSGRSRPLMKLPYRILVLDDDEHALSGIVELLRDAGHHVTGAATYDAAKRLLAVSPFDLLVSDVRLRSFNGLHLVMQTRADHPEMAIIIITGYDDPLIDLEAQPLPRATRAQADPPGGIHAQRVNEALAKVRRQRRWPRKRVVGGFRVTVEGTAGGGRRRLVRRPAARAARRRRRCPSRSTSRSPASACTSRWSRSGRSRRGAGDRHALRRHARRRSTRRRRAPGARSSTG